MLWWAVGDVLACLDLMFTAFVGLVTASVRSNCFAGDYVADLGTMIGILIREQVDTMRSTISPPYDERIVESSLGVRRRSFVLSFLSLRCFVLFYANPDLPGGRITRPDRPAAA